MKKVTNDTAWQRAFEDASEPPSAKVWEGIEARLAPQRPAFLPLFWMGTTALLFLGSLGGWLLLNKHTTAGIAKMRVEVPQKITLNKEKNATVLGQQVAVDSPMFFTEKKIKTEDSFQPTTPSEPPLGTPLGTEPPVSVQTKAIASNKITSVEDESSVVSGIQEVSISSNKSTSVEAEPNVISETPEASNSSQNTDNQEIRSFITTNKLPILQLTQSSPLALPSIVSGEAPRLILPKNRWLYVGMGAGNFTLNTSVASGLMFATSNPSQIPNNTTDTRTASGSGAYSVEVLAGKMVNKHFFAEMGLQYLRNETGSTDALRAIDNTSNSLTRTMETYARQKAITPAYRYTFEYLSVPVWVGYECRPEYRLGLDASVGIALDGFLRSSLSSPSNPALGTLHKSASEGDFTTVGVSTAARLGASYRVSPKVSFSLRGLFRRSLTNGTQNSGLRFHPRQATVLLGVKRRF